MKISDNSNNIKINIFDRFKFKKCENMEYILNKKVSIFNKLSNDLIKFINQKKVPLCDSLIQGTNKEINDNINNNKRSQIKFFKKKKLTLNQGIKEKLFDKSNLTYLKRKNKTFIKYNNLNIINNTNSFNSQNTSLYNIKTNKKILFENKTLSPISKNKVINIKYIKKNLIKNKSKKYCLLLNSDLKNKNQKNLNLFKKNSIYKNESAHNLTYNNKYKTNLNLNTFITQQDAKDNQINKDTKKIIYPYKTLLKKISKKNLTKFINTSSNIYSKQIDKIIKNNKSLLSLRKKFYKMKSLIYKFDINKSIENNLDYLINEDIEADKVYKTMRLYNNGLKNKVMTKNNDITKSIMISKSNADIINYCDNYYNMDDLYFYKHNKVYMKNYPPLSEKARKEPFNKNYKKIIYKSHKRIIDRKTLKIRKLVNSCLEGLKYIK